MGVSLLLGLPAREEKWRNGRVSGFGHEEEDHIMAPAARMNESPNTMAMAQTHKTEKNAFDSSSNRKQIGFGKIGYFLIIFIFKTNVE